MTHFTDERTTREAAGYIRQSLAGCTVLAALAAMAEAEVSIITRRAPGDGSASRRILLIVTGMAVGSALEAIRLARRGILGSHHVTADAGPSGPTPATAPHTIHFEGGRA